MSLSDPPTENNPGQYEVKEMSIIAPDGREIVTLGDSLGPLDSPFLDLRPGDSVIVAAYDSDAGDVIMVEVVGSDQMERIAANTLDDQLGRRLTRNPA